ncbi:MAG: glycosyl hydrolase [Acidobacteriota bacterium]
MYRSDDAGESFERINKDRSFLQRAWYYTHVFADPQDENTVYILNVFFHRSVDGGKSFETVRVPHGDNHDLWIKPNDHRIMIYEDDGGAAVSYNGGTTWTTQANQPTAEFYRVTTDQRVPYWVYGAQQDNSTVRIVSRTGSFGIGAKNWHDVGGCESGHIAVDPRDADIVYAGCYGGSITRYDHRTGQAGEITTYPQLALGQPPVDLRYRFQWNAPIRISPHDPSVIYHTSNYVHRSTDEGQSWQIISPDLTRNSPEMQGFAGGPITRDNTGVEVYGTAFAFEESPHQEGLLWVGSDDGRIHISRDGGASWDKITPKGMAELSTVNAIDLSAHHPGRAHVAVYRYRYDDFKPYVFQTNDYGKSWKLLTDGKNGIPENSFVRVVREDPDRKGLLYAGTEFGMYVSFNDGATWQSLQRNLPVTPITDLQVKEKDLVVATQGRAFWILDDLTPLHQLTDEVARSGKHLFRPRDAYRLAAGGFEIPSPVLGKNAPSGAIIHYYLAEELEGEVKVEILDASGKVVRSLSSQEPEEAAPNIFAAFFGGGGPPRTIPAKKGMNRWVWDLRYPDARMVEEAIIWGSGAGPKAVPGSYQVRLRVGEWSKTESFQVKRDPRLETTLREYQEQFDLAIRVRDLLSEAHDGVKAIREVRTQVQDLAERLKKAGHGEGVDEAAEAVTEKLTATEEKLFQTKNESLQDPLNFQPMLDNQVAGLYGAITGADVGPTDGSYQRYDDLKKELAAHRNDLNRVLETELAAFNSLVQSKNVGPVIVPK